MSSKSVLSIRPSATKRGISSNKAEKFLHRKLQMGKTKSYVSNHTREQMQEINAAIVSYRCSVHQNWKAECKVLLSLHAVLCGVQWSVPWVLGSENKSVTRICFTNTPTLIQLTHSVCHFMFSGRDICRQDFNIKDSSLLFPVQYRETWDSVCPSPSPSLYTPPLPVQFSCPRISC
jgi:hypothetical protein